MSDQDLIYVGIRGVFSHKADIRDVEYVRCDPAILTALPEVQAMLAAKEEDMARLVEVLIAAQKAKTEQFRETNRRLNRRVQLLEGWWQRRLERAKTERSLYMRLWYLDRKDQPLNVKALEEAAYQRGFEDGRDARFNIPPRRVKLRNIVAEVGGEA